MTWDRQPISAFFRGPLTHAVEGWVVVGGSILCALLALLVWLVPGVAGIPPGGANAPLLLFALWPICLLVIFVAMCGPNFHSRVSSIGFLLLSVAFPVWLVFRRPVAAMLGL